MDAAGPAVAHWRKVVAACVGIALLLAASGLAPAAATYAEEAGLTVVRRVHTGLHVSPVNLNYLAAKAAGGHVLHLPGT